MSEVGKGKPPKEHQFQPGNVPKGHRRKGQVGLLQRLRRQLEEEVPGQDRTIADALVTKIVAEALRSPIRYWPILKALERPTPPPTGDGAGAEPEAADDPAVAPDGPEDGLERVVWGGRGQGGPGESGPGGASGAPALRS